MCFYLQIKGFIWAYACYETMRKASGMKIGKYIGNLTKVQCLTIKLRKN